MQILAKEKKTTQLAAHEFMRKAESLTHDNLVELGEQSIGARQ